MKAITSRFVSTLVLFLLESLPLAEPTSDTAYDFRPEDIQVRGGPKIFEADQRILVGSVDSHNRRGSELGKSESALVRTLVGY